MMKLNEQQTLEIRWYVLKMQLEQLEDIYANDVDLINTLQDIQDMMRDTEEQFPINTEVSG